MNISLELKTDSSASARVAKILAWEGVCRITFRFQPSTKRTFSQSSWTITSPRREDETVEALVASRRLAWQRHDRPHRGAAVAGLDLLSADLAEAFAHAGDGDAHLF